MKKLIVAISIFALSITTPAFADTDLSSMSVEELATLKNDIEIELASRDSTGAFILPSGTYEIGVDLKPGKFIVYPIDMDIAGVLLCDTREDIDAYYSDELDDIFETFTRKEDPQLITLEEGKWYDSLQRLLFINAETTLMPWMPGYGE